jgi:hypothetical protein
MFEHVTAAEIVTAGCAVATLFIYFTATLIGAVIALFRKMDKVKEDILTDVKVKHAENNQRYEALNTLVVRHELLLNPEFANGRARHGH